jgi:GxxExxY protein
VVYDGVTLDTGYRLDIVVEDVVILELKCVEKLTEVHAAQLISYLRVSGRPLGLLIDLHVRLLRNGIRRLINGEIDVQSRVAKEDSQ